MKTTNAAVATAAAVVTTTMQNYIISFELKVIKLHVSLASAVKKMQIKQKPSAMDRDEISRCVRHLMMRNAIYTRLRDVKDNNELYCTFQSVTTFTHTHTRIQPQIIWFSDSSDTEQKYHRWLQFIFRPLTPAISMQYALAERIHKYTLM